MERIGVVYTGAWPSGTTELFLRAFDEDLVDTFRVEDDEVGDDLWKNDRDSECKSDDRPAEEPGEAVELGESEEADAERVSECAKDCCGSGLSRMVAVTSRLLSPSASASPG